MRIRGFPLAALAVIVVGSFAPATAAGQAQTSAPTPAQADTSQLRGRGSQGSAQACRVVADTAVVPTAGQVRERRELQARLAGLGRANGVAEPTGLLLVDVDSTRRGKVIFIETNYPQELVNTATRSVGEYLETLPVGKPYQALIRIDGEYQAMAPGKSHCPPMLENRGLLGQLMQRVMQAHPQSGKLPEPVVKNAVVRLVVNREGVVSYVEVERPTGDEHLDQYLVDIAERLRFAPAKLDGVAYDTRFRFTLTFNVR
jgi:TonB family protein